MKRYRPQRTKKSKMRRRIVIAFVAFFLIALIVYIQLNVTNVLKSIAEATMRSITTVAVNDAIYYTLSDQVRYEDLVNVARDDEGNIQAISSNSFQINRIARDTAYMSQQNLKKMSEDGIQVPLGAFTGVEAWAGFGPKITLKIIPISNVECRFVSEFEGAGINQTKHSIYLEIVADISIIMPSGTSNFASLTEVLICESVLVGKVPDTYLQADIFGNGYDLVPKGN
ncbi:MAG: sporulation protein YunB [Clostridia bacterium]|nr:sporulation protein YunB [Clostridia bacterium]